MTANALINPERWKERLKQAKTRARLKTITDNGFTGHDLGSYQARIKWKSLMNLHITGEAKETYLSETDWPLCSGNMHYVCASTGLIFNKETGREVRYSTVSLDLKTVEKTNISKTAFLKWLQKAKERIDEWRDFSITKPGPKTKEQKAAQAARDEEFEYE